MARITVGECIKLVNNQYELVIVAKERAVQLGRGATPAVDPETETAAQEENDTKD
jgi:DNA-directed RNA polymerase subunit omega